MTKPKSLKAMSRKELEQTIIQQQLAFEQELHNVHQLLAAVVYKEGGYVLHRNDLANLPGGRFEVDLRPNDQVALLYKLGTDERQGELFDEEQIDEGTND